MILRLRFSKIGPVRFVSHRDVARVWERAFRRVGLPLAFTQGFSPHPKVSFGLALPVGWESEAEFLDVTLAEPMAPPEVQAVLNAVLPEGMAVEAIDVIDAQTPSAASLAVEADYLVSLSGIDDRPAPDPDVIATAVAALWQRDAWLVPRRRKGRAIAGEHDDLRPAVRELTLAPDPPTAFLPVALRMRLGTQPRVVRPEEVCEALSAVMPNPTTAVEPRLVRRVAQLFSTEKEVPPIDAPVPSPT